MSKSSPTKVCPDCAEEVKASARICRYCRYEFEPLASLAPEQNSDGESENFAELGAAELYARHGNNTAIFALMSYEIDFAERAYEKHRCTMALLGLNAERETSREQSRRVAERQQAIAARDHAAAGRALAEPQQDRRTPAEICAERRRKEELARQQRLAAQKPGLATRALKLAAQAATAVAREMLAERPVEPERPLTRSERSRLEWDIHNAMSGVDLARRNGQGTGHWEAKAAIAAAKLANGRK